MRPSRLYFHLPESGIQADVIAENHCHWEYLPSLWRILIAHGESVGDQAPLAGEHALPTQTIVAPALEGIARLEVLEQVVLSHPLLHQLPSLPILLEGVLQFLDDRLGQFPIGERGRVLVAAQMGSNHFDEDPAEALETISDEWDWIESIGAEGTYHELEEALCFSRGRRGIGSWEAWSDRFGLATLSHPYFERLEIPSCSDEAEHAPPTRSYLSWLERHRPEDAQARRDRQQPESKLKYAWLLLCGLAVYLFRRVRGTSHHHALERHADGGVPDQHGLNDADYRDLGEAWRYTGLFPEFVDGKVGLCVLEEHEGRYRHGKRLIPPEWDEIDFPREASVWGRRGQTWTLIGLNEDHSSTVLADIACEQVGEYDHDGGICIVRTGRHYGLVHAYRRCQLAPTIYDEIKCDPYNGGFWRVRIGALWGMLNDAGELVHGLDYESIETDARAFPFNQLGWRMVRGGRVGWIDEAGTWQVGCEWDDVRPSLGKGLFAVARQSRWGIVSSGDQRWIPVDYLSAEPMALGPDAGHAPEEHHVDDAIWPDEPIAEFIAGRDQGKALVLFVVATEHGVGVVDQANRIVVPFKYTAVAPARTSKTHDTRWMCIANHSGRQGLWDLTHSAEVIAPAHDWLEMIVSPTIAPLAATFDGECYRLWHPDGRAAFDGAFRWVSNDRYFEGKPRDRDESRYRTGRIAEDWSKGKDARAALIVEGEPDRTVLLKPGLAVRDEATELVQAYEQRGDIGAAFQLAWQYRYADGVGRDDGLARLWAGRACGHEAVPAPADPSDAHVCEDNAMFDGMSRRKVQVHACLLFSDLLYEGLGGLPEPVLARHWAERAVAADETDKRARIELAKTLLDEQAGPLDHIRAHQLLEGPEKALDDYDALYYRAVLYRDGIAVRQDWARARALFEEAEEGGFDPAAGALADLLRKMSIVEPKAQARLLLQEAEFYAAKADA